MTKKLQDHSCLLAKLLRRQGEQDKVVQETEDLNQERVKMSFYWFYDSRERPRGRREAKWEKLENVCSSPEAEGEELVIIPIHRYMKISVFYVDGARPKSPRD